MWNEINNGQDVRRFMESVWSLHDSCVKEMRYTSGAYVNADLSMYPVNDRRALSVVIQRQAEPNSVIELEFTGLKQLKLCPADDQYTCEILDSTLILEDDGVYWADCGGLSTADFEHYEGTVICAAKLRWRFISGFLGKDTFFTSPV